MVVLIWGLALIRENTVYPWTLFIDIGYWALFYSILLPIVLIFLLTVILIQVLKAVNTYSFVYDSVPDRYRAQEMYDKVVSENIFMLKCCNDRFKTQEICIKLLMTF